MLPSSNTNAMISMNNSHMKHENPTSYFIGRNRIPSNLREIRIVQSPGIDYKKRLLPRNTPTQAAHEESFTLSSH
jgi:hypothetical protein